MARLKTGILISGRGSNLEALIEACRDPALPAEIVTVVSNKPDAAGLAIAREAGIATVALDHRGFADRAAFDDAVHRHLSAGRRRTRLSGRLHAAADHGLHRALA